MQRTLKSFGLGGEKNPRRMAMPLSDLIAGSSHWNHRGEGNSLKAGKRCWLLANGLAKTPASPKKRRYETCEASFFSGPPAGLLVKSIEIKHRLQFRFSPFSQPTLLRRLSFS